MANWQRHLDLKLAWQQALNKDITIQQLAKITAKQLKALKPFNDPNIEEEKDDLVEQFEMLADNLDADTDEFDYIMQDLYNWGDIKISGDFFDAKKVCWIKTNF